MRGAAGAQRVRGIRRASGVRSARAATSRGHRAPGVSAPMRGLGATTRAAFPEDVRAPAQDGARIAAFAIYLLPYQRLPEDRLVERMADLFGVKLAAGPIAAMSRNGVLLNVQTGDAIMNHVHRNLLWQTPQARMLHKSEILKSRLRSVVAPCASRGHRSVPGPTRKRPRCIAERPTSCRRREHAAAKFRPKIDPVSFTNVGQGPVPDSVGSTGPWGLACAMDAISRHSLGDRLTRRFVP
jgi:hypothetical protein